MGKESMIGLRDKSNTSIEKRQKGIVTMEFELESNGDGDHGSLSEATFWPVQHPTEPLEEDRPIICPMPYSSSVLKSNGLQEGRFSADIMRKRSDHHSAPRKSGGILEVTMEPPIRAVRKRHHPLGPDYRGAVAGPVRRVPPHNATMSQVLHQFNQFKS